MPKPTPAKTGKKVKKAKVQKEPKEEAAPETAVDSDSPEEELENPALFADMNQSRIAKLEKRGREFLKQKDITTKAKEKQDELDDECQLIMMDYQIKTYNGGGVHLVLKQGKTKLDGSLD